MRLTEIVKVDSKGRVTIPLVVREALNIIEGMNLILIADADRREIVLSPLPSEAEKLYELKIEFKDVPGALAKISSKLAEFKADIVVTQCTTVRRGENAECIMIIDFSKATKSAEEVKDELAKMEEVHLVQTKPLQHR